MSYIQTPFALVTYFMRVTSFIFKKPQQESEETQERTLSLSQQLQELQESQVNG